MDSGTWVKCTICDGHVSQVLFLAQRGINGNDKALGMMGMDKVGCLFQVQSMHRMTQSSVDINSVYFLLAQLMTDIRAQTVAGYTVTADTEKDQFRPWTRMMENAFS